MKFDLLEKVMIKEINVVGIIISVHFQIGKIEYQVRYFMDGEQKTIYYHDFELEKLNDN